ncbi:MAG: MFS transporter [Pseudomonadota bacterium]
MASATLGIGAVARSPAAQTAAFLFFANGFIAANWFVRIPAVKERLALSDAELGIALMSFGVGSVVALPVAGAMITRFGSARMSISTGMLYCAAFGAIGLAPSLVTVCAALFLAGMGNGFMDVSMNAQTNAVEQREGITMMSFAHAMFSLGMALGSIPAGIFASYGVSVAINLAFVGLPLAALIVLFAPRMVPDPPVDGPPPPLFAVPRGPLLFFGLLCLAGAIVEGAMADWTAIFVRESQTLSAAMAAATFGAFAFAMFVARLVGDSVNARLGPVLAVRSGLILAAAGLAVFLTGWPPALLLGAAAVGIGVAGVFPSVFTAAGRLKGHAPGPAMAASVTLGYIGFMAGPGILGAIADATSLTVALAALIPLALTGAALAGTLRTDR